MTFTPAYSRLLQSRTAFAEKLRAHKASQKVDFDGTLICRAASREVADQESSVLSWLALTGPD